MMNELFLFWFLIQGLVVSLLASGQSEKPKVIILMLDDLGKDWISCCGANKVETPNIDRLTANGIRFEYVRRIADSTKFPARKAREWE